MLIFFLQFPFFVCMKAQQKMYTYIIECTVTEQNSLAKIHNISMNDLIIMDISIVFCLFFKKSMDILIHMCLYSSDYLMIKTPQSRILLINI